MAISTIRNLAWLELTVKIPTTTFTNSFNTSFKKLRKVHLRKFNTSFQLFPATFSRRDSSHAPCPNERPWFSINSPKRWVHGSQNHPTKWTVKKMHVSLGETFFLCMRSFELIRYEVWIWNIYIYISCIHERYLGAWVFFKNKKHNKKSHEWNTYFLFNRTLPECWQTGPPPEVTLRPFELTTSVQNHGDSRGMG